MARRLYEYDDWSRADSPFGGESRSAVDQKLLVDMTRDETAFVKRIRQDLTLAMKFNGGARSFSKVVARPDNRPDAGVIQVADMFAGEARSRRGDISWGSAERLNFYRDGD